MRWMIYLSTLLLAGIMITVSGLAGDIARDVSTPLWLAIGVASSVAIVAVTRFGLMVRCSGGRRQ